MSEISVVFWDVGGVLLTNGWDHDSRRSAAEVFALDLDEFEYLHESTMPDFEIGHIDLDEYLRRAVFHHRRPFTVEEFKDFIFAQSRPHPETLNILRDVAAADGRLTAMLNNESLALNRYRIEKFDLARHFDLYFSSCFLGVRKPSAEIYDRALGIVQKKPDECLLIDDRSVNLEYPAQRGMATIRYSSPEQLRRELVSHGVLPG